ncbi:putative glucan endo-1,3-beta-D-glucosidase [Arabidopsis thaliana]|uniref:glucan endo-1,3-beta-D-glucosidase n=1 Tax=Arabidopsis thaliana x Arabidopsis arenosa TaxID=1240361 RepID=A0A8T2GKV3_9BRAS|nr:Glycoside hydrolase family 17 [Arabidopsis thaliana x Arabidopsis arenosa]
MSNMFSRIAMTNSIVLLLFSLTFLEHGLLFQRVSSLGINYGQVGDNLPPPDKVLQLLSSLHINKTRIYDTNPRVLTSFANSNIELFVTVENEMLPSLVDPQQALQWVTTRIKPYFPATKIGGIAVGNELYTDDDSSLIGYLVPAMMGIHGALVQTGLDKYIQVSTPNSLSVLQESYPPSAGCFRPEVAGVMTQLLGFLRNTNSPFWINAYPYFAYKDSPTKIPLDYVLFNPNPGMVDPYTKYHYDNMLYAQVDAVIFAMARLGFKDIEVGVSETGWPSKGDGDEVGATVANAAVYNKNILRRQLQNEGTPLRPNLSFDVYLFALFNEDLKPGPTSERNYGLYQPDETMTYNVGLLSSSSLTSTSTTSSTSIISLTSSASTALKKGKQRLMYWTCVYLLAIHMLIRRSY